MGSELFSHSSSKRNRRTGIVVAILSLTLILWLTARWAHQFALDTLQEQGEHQLSLYVSNLKGQLEKYEFLPEILATNRLLIQFLKSPEEVKNINALNRYLESINRVADASDTYLMNAEGWTIAASNWQSEKPFIGRNFSYRPYFQEAMQGNLGRYFALGSTSNKRGYYFAYPVRSGGQILGAVVMKIDLSTLEDRWSTVKEKFAVIDQDGVIFISTVNRWRYKSLFPLNDEMKRQIQKSRRYGKSKIGTLNIQLSEKIDAKAQIVNVENSSGPGYLMLIQDMPEAGWRIHLFTDLKAVNGQVLRVLGFMTILYGALVFWILYIIQRRKRVQERERYQQKTKQVLEERVRERTGDLSASNLRLIKEIEERRRIDQAFRETQEELIQAAKMAVLGQMASGINHELNQPLAAIRSYADNAQALLVRERTDDAKWNLKQISELTERMAKISRQLKVFSRKTSGQLVSVSLPAVVENALKIVGPNLKDTETEFSYSFPEQEVYVLADMVQLEQVLVNLINNAVHAVESQEERKISLTVMLNANQCSLSIHDNGPGIEEENLTRIFDPFFTTKSAEQGLGLGLSISFRIIEMMKGSLSAKNHKEGGAIFTLRLGLPKEYSMYNKLSEI